MSIRKRLNFHKPLPQHRDGIPKPAAQRKSAAKQPKGTGDGSHEIPPFPKRFSTPAADGTSAAPACSEQRRALPPVLSETSRSSNGAGTAPRPPAEASAAMCRSLWQALRLRQRLPPFPPPGRSPPVPKKAFRSQQSAFVGGLAASGRQTGCAPRAPTTREACQVFPPAWKSMPPAMYRSRSPLRPRGCQAGCMQRFGKNCRIYRWFPQQLARCVPNRAQQSDDPPYHPPSHLYSRFLLRYISFYARRQPCGCLLMLISFLLSDFSQIRYTVSLGTSTRPCHLRRAVRTRCRQQQIQVGRRP